MIIVKAPTTSVLCGGSLRELALDVFTSGKFEKPPIETKGEFTYYYLKPDTKITTQYVLEVLTAGGNTYNIPSFIVHPDKIGNIPEGLSHSIVWNENNEPVQKTWEGLNTQVYKWIETNDTQWYIGTQALGNNIYFDGDVFKEYLDAGINIKTQEEIKPYCITE